MTIPHITALEQARPYVERATRETHDGTVGSIRRAAASATLASIDAALSQAVAPVAEAQRPTATEKDIKRWQAAIQQRPEGPWEMGCGGSFDRTEMKPISDEMMAELAQWLHMGYTPWNGRSMPLTASDRQFMFMLYFSVQGLVARVRAAEKAAALAAPQQSEAVELDMPDDDTAHAAWVSACEVDGIKYSGSAFERGYELALSNGVPEWPTWATQILKIVREHSGYDGYDDQDGVDLVEETRECLRELAAMADRARAELRKATTPPAAVPAVEAADERERLTNRLLQAIEFADEALWAIATKQRMFGDTLEPIHNIGKASALAKAAHDRLRPAITAYEADERFAAKSSASTPTPIAASGQADEQNEVSK